LSRVQGSGGKCFTFCSGSCLSGYT